MPESRSPSPDATVVHVLLLEDNPEQAALLQAMLASAGPRSFDVEVASGLAPALKRLAAIHFDAVLLDLALAGGTGLANVYQTLAVAPDIAVVLLGSGEDEPLALKAVQEGVQDYLIRGQLEPRLLARSIICAITRKQTVNALLRTEEKYHRIFESLVEGIFQTTPDGHYLSANPALARIYGYASPEELMASVTDIARKLYVDPRRRGEFVRIMEEKDEVIGFESQINRKDGSIIWISENVRAIRDAKGRLRYYEGAVEEITNRRNAEEQLRNSEKLYHSLVETLPQNIFRKDLSERFTFANRNFCLTLGRPWEDIKGKTDFDFFPPALAAQYQKDDRWVMETGKNFATVEEHQPPGGGKIYVQVVKTPLHDISGKIIGLQGIFWDITEERKAQERERKAQAELAASQAELQQKNDQLEADMRMAREIQMALLPQIYPTFRGISGQTPSALRFGHRYHPSGVVGGDFFSILALSESAAGIIICDVMGHNVRAALITTMIRALVEELKPVAHEPGRLLNHLNRDLRNILKQTGNLVFTTAFYVVADLARKEFRYAAAGHPRPLMLRRATGTAAPLPMNGVKSGPALGFFENSAYDTARCDLELGDMVMLFTDGLFEVESPDHELFTQEMVQAVLQKRVHLPVSELFDDLLAEITRFSGGQEFQDDVCLVGVEVADVV